MQGLMSLDGKVKLELKHVQFDRRRFNTYLGNMGEIMAQEALLNEGFEVWIFNTYFPDRSPFDKPKKKLGDSLGRYLSCLYQTPPDENSLKKAYENKTKAL